MFEFPKEKIATCRFYQEFIPGTREAWQKGWQTCEPRVFRVPLCAVYKAAPFLNFSLGFFGWGIFRGRFPSHTSIMSIGSI